MDEKGNVIVYLKDASKLPETVDLRNIIDTKGETLESKFRLTYAIILNLLSAKDIDVIEMMKRSFSENTRFSQLPRVKERIRNLKKSADALENIPCPFEEKAPIEEYYKTIDVIGGISHDMYTDPNFISKAGLPKFALL